MSYVPPHMRNRKPEKKEVTLKSTEADFPAFVNERKQADFKGPTFASKIKQQSQEVISFEKEIVIPVTRSRYSYYERKYQESEESEESQSEPQPAAPAENDGWQTVERKVRIKKDKVQDALDNEDGEVEEEESAWDEQPEEYETYWDERKH